MEQQREGQGFTGAGQESSGGSSTGPAGSSATPGLGGSTGAGARPGGGPLSPDAAARAAAGDRKAVTEDQSMKERVGETVHSGKTRFAERLQRVGDRLEERARRMEQSGGVQGRAGHVALRASETLDRGADYLRTHEIDEIRDDLEHAIRQRPLLSIGIAAGAGFLLARLLRD